MKRIVTLDVVRGVVMMLMALDHVRDLLHVDSLTQSPTDLNTTTPFLFFTRYITHLCAPTFVFLAGTSVFLRHQQKAFEMPRYLRIRGFVLLLLEFTLFNLGLYFDPAFHTLLLEVIGSTGLGLLFVSFFISWLSPRVFLVSGLLILLLHNPALTWISQQNVPGNSVWIGLLSPTAFSWMDRLFIVGYPPIPWLGFMFLGLGLGPVFHRPQAMQSPVWLKLGIFCLLLFVVVRGMGIEGNPIPGDFQIKTILSFFNASKYPPSWAFASITLGGMFFLLAWVPTWPKRLQTFCVQYGQVPLFFFIVHFFLIHSLLFVVLLSQGIPWEQWEFTSGTFGRPQNSVSGVSLFWIYVLWPAVVLGMYYPCRFFYQWKKKYPKNWLQYI